MKIDFGLEGLSFDRQTGSEVAYRARSLSNFLSRNLKVPKLNHPNYSRIVIFGDGALQPKMMINSDKVLVIHVGFDILKYQSLCGTDIQEYFIELILEALEYASKAIPLPVIEIKKLIEDFRIGGYVNKWLFKKKTNKALHMRAELWFEMTMERFVATLRLVAKPGRIESETTVLETKPDELHYHYKLRDLVFDGINIRVLDEFGKITFSFDLTQPKG